MKLIVNRLAMLHVLLTLLFIRKLLKTDEGLVLYASISFLLMAFVLYVNRDKGNS